MPPLSLHDTLPYRDRPKLSLDGIDSLDELAAHPKLEALSLRHFPKVTSLEPLRALKHLRYLSLSTTPGWDGSNRHLTVDSFEPITALKKLEVLQIIGVVPKKDRLRPLLKLSKLRKLSIGHSNFYQLEDFAELSAKLPLARDSVQPVYQANFVSLCRRCKKHPLLFLAGTKPRAPHLVCPSCDRTKITAHLQRWNAAGGCPPYVAPETLTATPGKILALFGNPVAQATKPQLPSWLKRKPEPN